MTETKDWTFICYAREDRPAALRLYGELKQACVAPWLDRENIPPGADWERCIRDAITSSSYFLALLSWHSVTKRGFVHKEIKHALDTLDEFPEGKAFVIPVKLDDCAISNSRLRKLQHVKMYPSWEEGLTRLLAVFQPESRTMREEIEALQENRVENAPLKLRVLWVIHALPEGATQRDIEIACDNVYYREDRFESDLRQAIQYLLLRGWVDFVPPSKGEWAGRYKLSGMGTTILSQYDYWRKPY